MANEPGSFLIRALQEQGLLLGAKQRALSMRGAKFSSGVANTITGIKQTLAFTQKLYCCSHRYLISQVSRCWILPATRLDGPAMQREWEGGQGGVALAPKGPMGSRQLTMLSLEGKLCSISLRKKILITKNASGIVIPQSTYTVNTSCTYGNLHQ